MQHRTNGNSSTRSAFPQLTTVLGGLFHDQELAAHFNGANHRQSFVAPLGPAPADPARRRVWEIQRALEPEMLRRFLPAFHLEQKHKRDQVRRRKLDHLRRTDPLFERSMHILEWILPKLSKDAVRTLERDLAAHPHAFVRLYVSLRKLAEDVEHNLHALNHSGK